MRRRSIWTTVLLLAVMLVAAACGSKDAGSIVKDLDKKTGSMKSYSTSGTMTLRTGVEPQEYQVEVWYQKENYYRIALTNSKKDISQIVLKNDDGVFVLTPHLNKSFRFQSEWPKNQGQVYLFESLVESIMMDNERHFTTDGDSYVFDVLANYSNASLSRQKIWLNKKTYAPQHVEIYDDNNTALVVMNFNDFKFDTEFEKDSFDMQRNMTSGRIALPTLGVSEDGTGTADPTTDNGKGSAPQQEEVSVIEPGYIPEGVKKPRITETKLGDSMAIMLKYTGDYNYTLIETRPTEKSASYEAGKLVDLGYGFGVLVGEEKKTLNWMVNGTEFRLSSADLPEEEMINIAISTQDMTGK